MYEELSRGNRAVTLESGSGSVGSRAGQGTADRARRASMARKASGRRRRVDPTTCELDYSTEELEFMTAMQQYKQRSGRMFPTWSEVLEVLHSLGYEKLPTGTEAETQERALAENERS